MTKKGHRVFGQEESALPEKILAMPMATGVHGLGFLTTTSDTCDDESRHISVSVHDIGSQYAQYIGCSIEYYPSRDYPTFRSDLRKSYERL